MFYRSILTLLMLSGSITAMAEMQLKSYQSGVFQRSDVKLEDGERLVSGSREQIRETDRVRAKLGSKFGVRYSLNGKKSSGNRVTYLYLTPGVVELDGTRHDKYEEVVELQADVGSHVAAFEFTESWEAVPGCLGVTDLCR